MHFVNSDEAAHWRLTSFWPTSGDVIRFFNKNWESSGAD
jgi:hypothetical protein